MEYKRKSITTGMGIYSCSLREASAVGGGASTEAISRSSLFSGCRLHRVSPERTRPYSFVFVKVLRTNVLFIMSHFLRSA